MAMTRSVDGGAGGDPLSVGTRGRWWDWDRGWGGGDTTCIMAHLHLHHLHPLL